MKIKKGFWRTEDGRKAHILDVQNGLAIGWVGDLMHGWRLDGTSLTLSSFNLVGRWIVEPEWDWSVTCHWFNWLSYDEEEGWLLSSHKPWYKGKERYTCDGSWDAPVPEEHEPKWKGHPKDSIVCRPGFKPGMEVRS
jgi:hypothetical protein